MPLASQIGSRGTLAALKLFDLGLPFPLWDVEFELNQNSMTSPSRRTADTHPTAKNPTLSGSVAGETASPTDQ
jgi:hypothetical protein